MSLDKALAGQQFFTLKTAARYAQRKAGKVLKGRRVDEVCHGHHIANAQSMR